MVRERGRSSRAWLPPGLVLLGLLPVLLFFYGQIDPADPFYVFWDLHFYRRIAAAAPAFDPEMRQPFAYRLLGPFLASLIPLPDADAFRLLSALIAAALGVALYAFWRQQGLRPEIAALTLAIYFLNTQLFGFLVWNSYQVADFLSILYVTLMLIVMSREQWGRFGALLLLGSVTREVAALLVPVAFLYLLRRGRLRRDGTRLLLAVLPGLLVYVALRRVVPITSGFGLVASFVRTSYQLGLLEVWLRLLVNAFVPVSLFLLIFWEDTVQFVRRRPELLVFAGLVLWSTFFGANLERLMSPLVPVYYLLIGGMIQRHLRGRRGLQAALLLVALVAMPHHLIARTPLPERNMTIVLTLLSVGAASAIALWARLYPPEGGPGPLLEPSGSRAAARPAGSLPISK